MLKKLNQFLFVLILLPIMGACQARPKQNSKKIPLIIDADTANEVDDLFALVRAIGEPRFDLLGISSAQFHTSPLASDSTVLESQQINERLMTLLNRMDIPLPMGSNDALVAADKPQVSEAAQFIIEKAHELEGEEKLQLVILGSCTNVASAVLTDATIVPKIEVNYLGFWHEPKTNSYDKNEFNSRNDSLAVNVLLNYPKLVLRVMTATTSQQLVFEKATVDTKLKGKGDIADYLVNRWETYQRWWTKKDPEKTKWTMWDVALIEALAHPEWTTLETFTTPPANAPRKIEIYTEIDVDQMKNDFWLHMSKFLN